MKTNLLNTIVPLDQIEQAGVLLIESGKFVFCYGPHHASNGVYILRIGGHREPGESAWTGAAREAVEEASVVVRQIPAQVSVQTDSKNANEAPIVLSTHICALAYCLEHGFV